MAYSDDVQFEGDSAPMSASIGIVRAENKMAEWLMRKGVAKTQNQAQIILLGIAVAAILIGVVAWFVLSPHYNGPTPEELQQLSKMNS
jgi:ABC-type enterobactin transport system permease subunit